MDKNFSGNLLKSVLGAAICGVVFWILYSLAEIGDVRPAGTGPTVYRIAVGIAALLLFVWTLVKIWRPRIGR